MVIVIENSSIVIETAFKSRPSLDQITAFSWICELDNGFSDGLSLIETEIYLIVKMFEFMQVLDSTCHLIEIIIDLRSCRATWG